MERARLAEEEGRWAEAYTDAHDAYLAVADAAVLLLGFHAPPHDGEPVVVAVAHVALKLETDAFVRATSDAFIAGLPGPGHTGAVSSDDADWALDLATRAVHATEAALIAARSR